MASTYTLQSSSHDGRYLKLTCTQTKNIADNTSTIKWTLTSTGGNVNYYSVGPTTVKINGTQVYYKARVNYTAQTFPAAKGSTSGTITVNHNSSGDKSVSVSLTTAIYTSTTSTKSGTWTLDSIPRKATITSAPNFTSLDNPVLKYSNPAGTAVSSLQACISLDGSKDDIAYRDISKTGTSYTFVLTDAERAVLNNATTGNSRTVRFYVKTVISGTSYTVYSSKTYTIANTAITFSPSVYDINSTTTALTGDSSIIVKGYSTIYAQSGAAAQDGATITSQSITCGSKTVNDSYAAFLNAPVGSVQFSATDSRGNTGYTVVDCLVIDYVKLTCNIGNNTPTAAGDFTLVVKGNYYNGSFGATTNTLTVQYRIKFDGGDFGEWNTIPYTLSGNTYTAETTMGGMDYQTKYTFEARAIDRLLTVTSTDDIQSEPIFDWSATDFNFNVPINIGGNTVLRENADYGHIVLSANSSSIYLRPNGTESSEGEIKILPSGDIISPASIETSSNIVSGGAIMAQNAKVQQDLSIEGTLALCGCEVATKNDLSNYALASHTHSGYSAIGHTHSVLYGSTDNIVITGAYFRPQNTKAKVNLGSTSYRWIKAYVSAANDISSDMRLKEDFSTDFDKYVDMLDKIEPTSYFLKAEEGEERKRHTGYIAQKVWKAMDECGIPEEEFAGFNRYMQADGSVYTYGLAYEEFIPILHAKINKLEKRIEELEAKLNTSAEEV